MRFIVILCFLFGGCASWTPTDTKYEIAFQFMNAADAYTTARIRHTENVEEGSSVTRHFLGRQPEETEVALLFITYGISHYMIAKALPRKWRRFYQVSTIGRSTYMVVNNCNLGLCP